MAKKIMTTQREDGSVFVVIKDGGSTVYIEEKELDWAAKEIKSAMDKIKEKKKGK